MKEKSLTVMLLNEKINEFESLADEIRNTSFEYDGLVNNAETLYSECMNLASKAYSFRHRQLMSVTLYLDGIREEYAYLL